HVPVGPHLRRRPGTAQLVLPWSRGLKCLANRLTGVVQLRGDLADGPPFATVQMSGRLNIDPLEHLLSSLTPKLLLEVRVSRPERYGLSRNLGAVLKREGRFETRFPHLRCYRD